MIYVARRVPVESPGWACVGVFTPPLVAWYAVRGNLVKSAGSPVIGQIISRHSLQIAEWTIEGIMIAVSFAFFCRLLQICDHKYFDQYKLEEQL